VVRLAIVFVISVSWLALANHCELAAAIASIQERSHSCCKMDESAAKAPAKKDQKDSTECCKAFHPVIATAAKNIVRLDFSSGVYSHFIAPIVFLNAPQSTVILELDTGPPGATSFAEVVLQRSLLAHAPPTLI